MPDGPIPTMVVTERDAAGGWVTRAHWLRERFLDEDATGVRVTSKRELTDAEVLRAAGSPAEGRPWGGLRGDPAFDGCTIPRSEGRHYPLGERAAGVSVERTGESGLGRHWLVKIRFS